MYESLLQITFFSWLHTSISMCKLRSTAKKMYINILMAVQNVLKYVAICSCNDAKSELE